MNDDNIPRNCSFPRQRASHYLACSRCKHFMVGETVFYCDHRKTEFPDMCVEYEPEHTEEPGSLLRWIYRMISKQT